MSATAGELRRLLARAPFAKTYGFRVKRVTDGECTVEVPFRKSLERPGGIVCGPALMAAADAATWLAILTRLGAGDGSVTLGMTTTFLAAARREGFRCSARVVRWGRRVVYAVAECVAAEGRILSHHTVTYVRVDAPPALLPATRGVRRPSRARTLPSP